MKKYIGILALVLGMSYGLSAQNVTIKITESSALTPIYGESIDSDELLTFDDLDIEFGYMLYTTEIMKDEAEEVVLQIENVRDYGAAYVNGKYIGSIDNEHNRLTLNLVEGKSTIEIYAENIGRITYGPEILDNSKGLFGEATLNGEAISSWIITPLNIKESDVTSLPFEDNILLTTPAFFKGTFELAETQNSYLDTSGWGMGEAWINGEYLGAYWEKESQKTIPVPKSVLKIGKNELVIFDLKNNGITSAKLTDKPVFD